MINEVIIATEGYLNDAKYIMDTLSQLIETAKTISEDATLTGAEINVDINPLSDRSDMKHCSGNMFLIEETLTDGSKVYNIEIFS
jgi:hypothetical protein